MDIPCCTSQGLSHLISEQVSFLERWRPLWSSNCVEVFSRNLCQKLDPEWVTVLRQIPLGDLLEVPSGFSLHTWPASLQDFVSSAQKLGLPRGTAADKPEQVSALLDSVGFGLRVFNESPREPPEDVSGLRLQACAEPASIPCRPITDSTECRKLQMPLFLQQGMSPKKRHEIQELAHLIALIARRTEATHVVDVGSGQGGLAQVLSIAYGLPVVAVETCSHNSKVASFRANKANRVLRGKQEPVFPHDQVAELRNGNTSEDKQQQNRTSRQQKGEAQANLPTNVVATVTLSNVVECMSSILKPPVTGAQSPSSSGSNKQPGVCPNLPRGQDGELVPNKSEIADQAPRVVLVGLHACGDLTPAILKAFANWTDVVGVVSLGCCYNVLTEPGPPTQEAGTSQNPSSNGCVNWSSTENTAGFPMSSVLRARGFPIGHGGRDLACQSADRWRTTDLDLARQNFEVHAFRAMLQVLLGMQFPDMDLSKVRVGKLGKAARRRKQASLRAQACSSEPSKTSSLAQGEASCVENNKDEEVKEEDDSRRDLTTAAPEGTGSEVSKEQSPESRLPVCPEAEYQGFVDYVKTACARLALAELPQESLLHQVWAELAPKLHLVRIYWVLRAVLAPVLEALIIVDRLLYMQEQTGCVVAGRGLAGLRNALEAGGLEQERSVEQGSNNVRFSHNKGGSEHKQWPLAALVLPVFQAELSPRNMAIIAVRNKELGRK